MAFEIIKVTYLLLRKILSLFHLFLNRNDINVCISAVCSNRFKTVYVFFFFIFFALCYNVC